MAISDIIPKKISTDNSKGAQFLREYKSEFLSKNPWKKLDKPDLDFLGSNALDLFNLFN